MTDSTHVQQQEERRLDETPAHRINIQSLTTSVSEPQVVDNHQFDTSRSQSQD